MKGKSYHSLMIMPSAPGKRVMKFTLPSYLWGFLCFLLLAVSVWAGVATWSIYRQYEMVERCDTLESENESAKAELRNRTKEVKYLSQQLKKIREKAGFIEKFLGLESKGPAQGHMGQGGEEVPVPQGGYSEAITPTPLLQAVSFNPNLVDRLSSDLGRIIEVLMKNQAEMEHTPSISPVEPKEAWISSGFGVRTSPFTGKDQVHLGVDLAGCRGTPILATADGKVAFVGVKGPMGLMVEISHNRKYTTFYGHLLKAEVKSGRTVKRGDIIGYMGNSGRSTGYHVHYSIEKNGKQTNPIYYMMDWEKANLFAAAEEADQPYEFSGVRR